MPVPALPKLHDNDHAGAIAAIASDGILNCAALMTDGLPACDYRPGIEIRTDCYYLAGSAR